MNDKEPRRHRPPLIALLRILGSLQLAVAIIAVYAIVLAWATLLERQYGAAAAHFAVYDAGWFTAINVLLGINVLCSAIVRFPWKRRQTGFLVTHLGVVVLLVGCLVTQQRGVEAQLPIFEGRTAHRAVEESYHFKLHVRPLNKAGEVDAIPVPFVAGPFSWDRYARLSWFPWRVPRRSRGTIYDAGGIKLEALNYTPDPQPRALVRLTVDGTSKEFEISAASDELPEPKNQTIDANGRRVTIALRSDEIDLGFQLYLHKFQRKLDPGTGMPSHYSSLVDFLDRGKPPRKLAENVLITLNAPIDFTDPRSGRTYRLFQSSFSGPWTPGQPEFDELVGSDRSRDQLFLSRLSVNYDPGRGLKYLGSFLILLGIVMVYYMRSYFFQKDRSAEQQPIRLAQMQ